MSEDANLEEMVSGEQKTVSRLRQYIVDTTSSWLYWTPLMTITEYCSGMETKEILKSRLMSIGVAMFIARPYGMFRQYWAEVWKADATSSKTKKTVVDTTAHMCFQIPIYSTMLYISGVSLEEGIAALTTGVAIGTAAGRPFGYFQDKWRKLWRTKPTLDTRE